MNLPLILLVAAQLLFFKPSFSWYVGRITDGSDEPLGLIALVAMGVLAALQSPRMQGRFEGNEGCAVSRKSLEIPGAFLILFLLTSPFLPPLGGAAFASLSIATLLGSLSFRRPLHLGFGSLALLSLPLISTLQFYAGFPLRYATGQVVAATYRILGFPVYAEGTLLRQGNATVWIDAPCSGVKALWCSLFFISVLIVLKPLSRRHTSVLWSATSAAVFVGNCARNALLFISESSPISEEVKHTIHHLVGLSLIGSIAAFSFLLWTRLPERFSLGDTEGGSECRVSETARRLLTVSIILGFGFVVVFRGGASLSSRFDGGYRSSPEPKGIPEEISRDEGALVDTLIKGKDLSELPLSSRERRWAADFPGSIRRFRRFPSSVSGSGHRSPNPDELLLRTVRVPTRKLHPISDCLRGAGYRVSPLPAHRGGDGILKGCVRVEKGGVKGLTPPFGYASISSIKRETRSPMFQPGTGRLPSAQAKGHG